MSKRQGFRPLAIDVLEDRVVLSHAAAVSALQAPFPGTVDAQNTAYVQALYAFVGRVPNPGGVEFHEDQLTSGRLSRFQVAQQFLHTPEAGIKLTTGLFQLLLNRNPTPSEIAFYTPGPNSGPHALLTETARILGSDAYFNHAGGTNQGFISEVYEDIFGRATDPGAQLWVNELDQGALRQHVAAQILSTPEGAASGVSFAYNRVLGRAPDAGAQPYVNYILRGGALQNVIASLLASQEYYDNAQVRFLV